MKKNRIQIYVLLGIFLGLFFCFAAGNEPGHHSMQQESSAAFSEGKASTLSTASIHSWPADFQKSESLTAENGSLKEGTLTGLQGSRQMTGLFFCLALIFLISQELKAGLLAFLKFCFILPRYPGHIIEVIHRKDGKKRLLF